MFDQSKTFTDRIAGGVDLLIDVATLGEYGLEEVVDTSASEADPDRHAVRSHSGFNPQPHSGRKGCAAPSRARRNVVELDRFLRPRGSAPAQVAGDTTTLAAVIPINAKVAAGETTPIAERGPTPDQRPDADPEIAVGYRPCTAAARRLTTAA